MTSAPEDIRETVRARYAAAATTTSCCGAAPAGLENDAAGTAVFGAALYGDDAAEVAGLLGCGVPTAVADLHCAVDAAVSSGTGRGRPRRGQDGACAQAVANRLAVVLARHAAFALLLRRWAQRVDEEVEQGSGALLGGALGRGEEHPQQQGGHVVGLDVGPQ